MPDTPFAVRPDILDFEPYSPGLTIDEIKERYGLSRAIKLSSNENPLGASPMVRKALEKSSGMIFRYAQSGNPAVVKAIARRHGINPATIAIGNGSDEVIDLLVRARVVPGKDNVICCKPCFSLYRLQSRLCGVELREVPLKADFTFDWDALAAAADENTALIFITTPDNPSAFCPPVSEVESFARRLPSGALLVVDEAYMEFTDGGERANSLLPRIGEFSNIAILRTFSKCFGLAGLRLGYGVMPAPLADYLCRVRQPFSINIMAEIGGLAALEDQAFLEATLKTVSEGREYIYNELTALGCKTFKSQASFLMFKLPEACRMSTDDFFTCLLKRGLIIRKLTGFGLPDYLRVSVGNERENIVFIKAARELITWK